MEMFKKEKKTHISKRERNCLFELVFLRVRGFERHPNLEDSASLPSLGSGMRGREGGVEQTF